MKNKSKALSRQEELNLALNLSAENLALNQTGRFSQAQISRILKEKRMPWFWDFFTGGLFLFVATCLACFLVFIIKANVEGEMNNQTAFVVFFLFFGTISLICACAGFFVLGRLHQNYDFVQQDIKAGRVKATQGLAIVDTDSRAMKFFLTINEQKFPISRNALLRIKHLEPHILYYLPQSKIVVAVEVLETNG